MSKYSDEFVKDLVEAYQAVEGYEAQQAVIVEKAKFTGFTIRGLRSKLVREGVYQAKEVSEDTPKRVRKAELVAQLAELVDVPEIEFDTFEKATRKALEVLVGRVRALKEAD